jgi:hypothetical protein
MGEIIIKEVLTRRDKHKFIYLPSRVHRHDPNWLPPIYMDERELYNRKKNKSYQYSDTVFYLAYRGIIRYTMNSMAVSVSWNVSKIRKLYMH